MGIKNIQGSSILSDLPQSKRDELELYPGGQNELWDELINMRMQFDGNYRRIRPRGGLTLIDTFFGQVRTIKGFSAYVGSGTKDYVVIHTALGNAYLINKADHIDGSETPETIFSTGTFNTTGQVSIFNSGTTIFIFDFIDKVYKIYDIETDTAYNWLGSQSTSIGGWSWNESGDWTEDNIWGFRQGSEVIVLQNFVSGAHIDADTGLLSYRSFRATIDFTNVTNIVYEDKVGIVRNSDASDYIGMIPATPDTEPYDDYESILLANGPNVKGSFQVVENPSSDDSIVLTVGNIRVPASGVINVINSDSNDEIAEKMYDALNEAQAVRALWDISISGSYVFLERPDAGEQRLGINFDVTYFGDNSGLGISATNPIPDQVPRDNDDYVEPIIYRGYLIVDLLVDGSYAIAGRPVTVFSTVIDILRLRRTSIDLTVPLPSPSIEKRYLFATRWQTTEDNVFTPSRPDYPNNAFFLAKELDLTQPTVVDQTPDEKLISPLSGFIQMSAGIPQLFSTGQLTPTSGDSYKGALFLGGYRINRPTPQIYTDPTNPNDQNIYADFESGTNLTNNPAVFVEYEYTDGKRSSLIDTGEVLTNATKSFYAGLGEENATITFEFTQQAQSPGATVSFKIDSQPGESVSFDPGTDVTPSELAEELANYINGGTIGPTDYGAGISNVTATHSAGDVTVAWDTGGSEGNFESATVTHTNGILINGQGFQTRFFFNGGLDAVRLISKSGNTLQIHSLNALVSKVYIIASLDDSSYKLIREVESAGADFHGKTIYLPNTDVGVAALKDYTVQSADPVTTVEVSDGIVMAIPFNQPLIPEQFSIENSERIVSIVPTQFDTDKTQLRFRMTVFTDRSVQIGYVILDGTTATFDFEVVGAGVAVTNRYGAWRVEGNVFYQADDGIYVYNQQSAGKIIDRYQYDLLAADLQHVVYNRRHGEYWLLFAGNRILVTNLDGSVRKIFDFSTELGPIRSATYSADQFLLAIGGGLYLGEVDGVSDDFNPIVAEMISAPIGNEQVQTKILEVTVGGQDLTVDVGLDMSLDRLERTTEDWDKVFGADAEIFGEDLYIHGVPFTFHKRGVMPRVRIKTTGDNDGFISHISVTHVMTENKGKAR